MAFTSRNTAAPQQPYSARSATRTVPRAHTNTAASAATSVTSSGLASGAYGNGAVPPGGIMLTSTNHLARRAAPGGPSGGWAGGAYGTGAGPPGEIMLTSTNPLASSAAIVVAALV